MTPDPGILIVEIVGEGKLDIGPTKPGESALERPELGVVPILVSRICGSPSTLMIKRRKLAYLEGKGLEQKVQFSKRNAKLNGSAGIVVVLDTEGEHAARMGQLAKGRDAEHLDFPAAVGAAHPCIEAWLLSDISAIRRGMGLNTLPEEPPTRPEDLTAPHRKDGEDPKSRLARCAGRTSPLSAIEAGGIATLVRLERLEERCPTGFAPFKAEVEQRIRPLFEGPSGS